MREPHPPRGQHTYSIRTMADQYQQVPAVTSNGSEESRKMCADMFGKVSEYVNGELAATSAEYELLLRLNQITTAKYADMSKLAGGLTDLAERLNDKFASLQQYCDQIDQVEASVTELEQMAYRLDTYAKQLEAKFKTIEKR